MRSPKVILENLQKHSKEESYKYERLYRNLYNEDYKDIYHKVFVKYRENEMGINDEWIRQITEITD